MGQVRQVGQVCISYPSHPSYQSYLSCPPEAASIAAAASNGIRISWCPTSEIPVPLPATGREFPGNGATDDSRTDNANVIRLHRIGFSQAVHR